ncbi:DegT/DnrJ/EryC1/StrS family aminotransferase [bacterium]|nr:DegT/DnrJ/EryC1/StrS family aminotransferase [bacterium]
MNIPFVDLKTQYHSIKDEIHEAMNDVLENTAFVLGKRVHDFEDGFAKLHNAKFCLGTSNGTTSLHLALWALGIKTGDEVILPVNTFFATAEAVAVVGAKPVLVDNDEFYNIDVTKIEEKITPKTKMIIPVHLYGQPANVGKIREIADKNGLLMIEDCAQVHCGEFEGKRVGTFGKVGCFSFYPGKNLGAYGEAGGVITNDEELRNKMQLLRDHGSKVRYVHEVFGHNYRMEGLQGAVLGVKLKYIEKWTEMRRKNAALYNKHLAGIPQLATPKEASFAKHVYHLYVVQVENREELIKFLNSKGISTGLHYPIPLHLQKAFECYNYKKGDFPGAEAESSKILSLPMFPELTEEQIIFVADTIKEFYR